MYFYIILSLLLSPAASFSVRESLLNILEIIPGAYDHLEDSYHSVFEVAQKYGYPMKNHTVVTEDGYILQIHRIQPKHLKAGKVVLLMAGLWSDSSNWIMLGPKKSLAYKLVDEGYDVWIGNDRGNKHSLRHSYLSPDSFEFWNFNREQLSLYDLSTTIDHVLKTTGEKSIFYVGYSIGTTSVLVLNSMRPEYNKKIKLIIALAPVAFVGHARYLQVLNMLASHIPLDFFKYFIPSPSLLLKSDFWPILCNMFPSFCVNTLNVVLSGPNSVSAVDWTVIMGHFPTGASTMEVMHYLQLTKSKRFCRFDYGEDKNLEMYGQKTPPDYNLTAVTTRTILVYSEEDSFSDYRDVEILQSLLPNVVGTYRMGKVAHMDFIFGVPGTTLVNPYIVKQLEKYQNQSDCVQI